MQKTENGCTFSGLLHVGENRSEWSSRLVVIFRFIKCWTQTDVDSMFLVFVKKARHSK